MLIFARDFAKARSFTQVEASVHSFIVIVALDLGRSAVFVGKLAYGLRRIDRLQENITKRGSTQAKQIARRVSKGASQLARGPSTSSPSSADATVTAQKRPAVENGKGGYELTETHSPRIAFLGASSEQLTSAAVPVAKAKPKAGLRGETEGKNKDTMKLAEAGTLETEDEKEYREDLEAVANCYMVCAAHNSVTTVCRPGLEILDLILVCNHLRAITAYSAQDNYAGIVVTVSYIAIFRIVLFSANKVSYYSADTFDEAIYNRATVMNLAVCAAKLSGAVLTSLYLGHSAKHIRPVFLVFLVSHAHGARTN